MEYNRLIDHTDLKPEATKDEIEKLCLEAKEHHFASVCINPAYIRLCASLLKGTDTKVCTVIGFPLGATMMASKISEAKEALFEGAEELDMVINIGRLKDHDDDYVRTEIAELKKACGDKVLKVIIECCLLTDEEKVRACLLSKEAKADFVKTSTGFSKGGATVADVALMRKTVGPEMGVKAAGGIRDKETMLQMIEAGATRIGTSKGVELIK
ncbi:MAG: deoxyribose-phosphate aldolase [Bacilli bacterium]